MSQRELARLIGYKHKGDISLHERSKTIPPLLAAFAYEIVFRVPASAIFSGLQISAAQMVEDNLDAFEKELQTRQGRIPRSKRTAHKLEWLTKRKAS